MYRLLDFSGFNQGVTQKSKCLGYHPLVIAMIIPCYNEETRFNIEYWKMIMQSVPESLWIYVNDGSTDQTFKILQMLVYKDSHVLNLDKNVGKGEAIRAGFNFAFNLESSKEIRQIGFLDSDGAFSLIDIVEMVNFSSKQFELDQSLNSFIGSRVKLAGRKIHRDNRRHYLGRAIGTFIGAFWGDAPYDTQSGFKIFRVDRDFLESISLPFQTRWFFDIELLLRLQSKSDAHPWEFPVTAWKEVGNSKITLRQSALIMREIIQIRKIMKTRQFNFGS